MEEQIRYTEGFNYGYWMMQYRPELAGQLASMQVPEDRFVAGFVAGLEERRQERAHGRQEELRELREKGLGRGKDIERQSP